MLQRLTGAFTAAARQSGSTMELLEDNSFNHRPMDIPDDAFQHVLDVIAELDGENEPGVSEVA